MDELAESGPYELAYRQVLRCARGDFRPWVRRGAEELATDAAGFAYMQYCRGFYVPRPGATMLGWFLRTSMNRFFNLVRTRRGLGDAPLTDARFAGTSGDPSDSAARRETLALLKSLFPPMRACVEQLEPAHQTAFVMRVLDDRSYDEIGEAAGEHPPPAPEDRRRWRDAIRERFRTSLRAVMRCLSTKAPQVVRLLAEEISP